MFIFHIFQLGTNPFGDGDGDMKTYFHAKCMFETFVRARATTKVIEDPEDLQGFDDLQQTDQDIIKELIKGQWSRPINI